jgi:hypothetical protein
VLFVETLKRVSDDSLRYSSLKFLIMKVLLPVLSRSGKVFFSSLREILLDKQVEVFNASFVCDSSCKFNRVVSLESDESKTGCLHFPQAESANVIQPPHLIHARLVDRRLLSVGFIIFSAPRLGNDSNGVLRWVIVLREMLHLLCDEVNPLLD